MICYVRVIFKFWQKNLCFNDQNVENLRKKKKKERNTAFSAFPMIKSFQRQVNTLPNNKILDWSKLEACADDKRKVTENLQFAICTGKGRKLREKEKMLVTGIFFFSHYIFKRLFSQGP